METLNNTIMSTLVDINAYLTDVKWKINDKGKRMKANKCAGNG